MANVTLYTLLKWFRAEHRDGFGPNDALSECVCTDDDN
jgi:hypothetical protein